MHEGTHKYRAALYMMCHRVARQPSSTPPSPGGIALMWSRLWSLQELTWPPKTMWVDIAGWGAGLISGVDHDDLSDGIMCVRAPVDYVNILSLVCCFTGRSYGSLERTP